MILIISYFELVFILLLVIQNEYTINKIAEMEFQRFQVNNTTGHLFLVLLRTCFSALSPAFHRDLSNLPCYCFN